MDTEFGILLNVLCIFAYTYFLAQITNITDGYIAKRILPSVPNNADDEPTKDLNIQALEVQVALLTQQNEDLEREVNALKHKYYISLYEANNFDIQKVCQVLKNNIDMKPVDQLKPILTQTDVWKKYLSAEPVISQGAFPEVVSTYDLQKIRGLMFSKQD